jgi:hypothetical protein
MSHLPHLEGQDLSHVAGQDSLEPSISSTPQCCSLQRWMVPLLALVTVISICTAAYFAGHSRGTQTSQFGRSIGELPLINATAAVTSEKYSIATGGVSDDSEGLFMLDHNSGLLQCTVIYPRLGKFMALFTANVAEALGTGAKGGRYMMVTGDANFQRSSSNPVALTVVYVMDTATGNYACYGIPFAQTAVPRNKPQQGAMVLINTGTANPVIDRDNLR